MLGLPRQLLARGGRGGDRPPPRAPLAATNRLHVGLTTLRNLGLRELLMREEAGYCIAPEVALIVRRAARD